MRGQQEFDLADVVGGGNGFGTGQTLQGIDPATGEIHSALVQSDREAGHSRYAAVTARPLIDGVFVPALCFSHDFFESFFFFYRADKFDFL